MAKLEDEEDRKNWKIDVRASLSHSALRNAAPGAEIPRSAGGDAELDRIIGRQIANLRVLRAIAKAEFSAALGIPVLTLQAVESGRFRFNPETFMRAALVLGVRPSDLFRDAAEKIALDMIVENWSLSASPPRGRKQQHLLDRIVRVVMKCDDMIQILDSIESQPLPGRDETETVASP